MRTPRLHHASPECCGRQRDELIRGHLPPGPVNSMATTLPHFHGIPSRQRVTCAALAQPLLHVHAEPFGTLRGGSQCHEQTRELQMAPLKSSTPALQPQAPASAPGVQLAKSSFSRPVQL